MTPQVLTSGGKIWQFYPRSAGRCTPITDIWWANLADLPRSAGRRTPQMHYGIYIMGCISQPFWILQEKVGIFFYFWIIRVVNSQHCRVMSDVTSSWHPQHPPNEDKRFQLWQLILPNLTCNMDVGVHIGRWSARCTPPVMTSTGQEWQFQVSYKQINWQIYPRSEDRCTPQTYSDQEWQFQVSYKEINWEIYPPQHHQCPTQVHKFGRQTLFCQWTNATDI